MLRIKDLFDLTHTQAEDYLLRFEYPWQALDGIKDFIISLIESLDKEEYIEVSDNILIHKTAVVAPSAFIGAPCIVGENSEIRHGAFVRGSALIGKNCVVGNSSELKNVILFDNVQTPHYNYVGDSILGYKAHMGAGSITSNVKSDYSKVVVRDSSESVNTGRKKCGAMLGDYAEIGCNAVLNPGTVIGRHSNVYPLSCVRGTVPEHSIMKTGGIIVKKKSEQEYL